MEIFEKEYTKVADTYLLPLTGLNKDTSIVGKSYLFWNEYSIENYHLVLVYEYDDPKKMKEFLCNEIFPILDKKGYVIETYDIEDRCIFILDISEWALDIELCLSGKYSKLSGEAKGKIEKYHYFNGSTIPLDIYVAFYPNKAVPLFSHKTAIEYVAETYKLDLSILQKVGELGSKYVKLSETLLTNIDEIIKV